MDQDKKDFGSWWVWILALVILSVVALTALNYAGVIGKTIVEREVFEQSYQYTAGQKQKIATFQAQMAEIERQLASPDLDGQTRTNLEAQAASIRIQLNAARSTQK
jgi:hypothetical protein